MTEHLTDVKEVPSKDWMTRWSALQVANESTQGIAASALVCEIVAEVARLTSIIRGKTFVTSDCHGELGACSACGKTFECGARVPSTTGDGAK